MAKAAVGESQRSGSGEQTNPFTIKDCDLVALATGKKARLLQEFRNELADIEAACIYHHFWGGLLQARFEEREYNNDFASWVRHGLHDAVLAERLAALDPTDFPDIERLREAMLDLIDSRVDELESPYWMPATLQFEFIRSQIVVFDTELRLQHPRELAETIEHLSTGSIFYHFIDARRRTAQGHDDFSDWLTCFGEECSALCEELAGIDPYFGNLSELRQQLARLFRDHFKELAP